MKITIPSRVIHPPTAPPDAGPVASPAPSVAAPGPPAPSATTTIKIKQPGATGQAAPVPIQPQGGQNQQQLSSSAQNAHTPALAGLKEAVYVQGTKLFNQMRDAKKDGRLIASDFQHLPPRESFPDYYAMIKKPISFAEIRARLERRDYTDIRQMAEDFHQMFVNAKRYNQKGSDIFNDAKKLDKIIKNHFFKLTGQDLILGAGPSTSKTHEREDGSDAESRVPTPSTSATLPAGPSKASTPTLAAAPAAVRAPSAGGEDRKPLKKKAKTGGAAHVDKDKPMTLTKWLSIKVDDLVAVTDERGRRLADIFTNLPDRELYPDYYQLIQRPVSFQLVRSRLKNRNYPTISAFVNDVQTVFANARFYNEESSQIYQDSLVLGAHFEESMKEPPPEFFVRPRNKDQMLVDGARTTEPGAVPGTARGDGDRQRSASAAVMAPYGSEWPTAFAAPEYEKIEDVKISDVFEAETSMPAPEEEDHKPILPSQPLLRQQQPQSDRQDSKLPNSTTPAGVQDDKAVLAVPATVPQYASAGLPSSIPLHKPSHSSGVISKPRILSQISTQSAPSSISAFKVTFHSPSINFAKTLQTHLIRQHSLSCPSTTERVEVIPQLSQLFHAQPVDLKLSVRPASQVGGASTVVELLTTPEENQLGATGRKWLVRLSDGLNVLEFMSADKQCYRIFICKSAL